MTNRFRLRKMLRSKLHGSQRTTLPSDVRGAVAIEFAFIAAPFAALMVAILQTSLVFFAQQNLETAAEKSVRSLMTGKFQSQNKTKQDFKNLVCANLPKFMSCDNLMIDVQSATSFASASTSSPTITFASDGKINNNWVYSPGEAGSINIVRVMYVWSVRKGPLGFDLSTMSSSNRLLYATSVFKTEPYS